MSASQLRPKYEGKRRPRSSSSNRASLEAGPSSQATRTPLALSVATAAELGAPGSVMRPPGSPGASRAARSEAWVKGRSSRTTRNGRRSSSAHPGSRRRSGGLRGRRNRAFRPCIIGVTDQLQASGSTPSRFSNTAPSCGSGTGRRSRSGRGSRRSPAAGRQSDTSGRPLSGSVTIDGRMGTSVAATGRDWAGVAARAVAWNPHPATATAAARTTATHALIRAPRGLEHARQVRRRGAADRASRGSRTRPAHP